MSFDKTKEELNRFAKYVIQQARTNLTKQGKNVSSDLYKSLDYDVYDNGAQINLEFYMLPYGNFIDEGVRGTKSSYIGTRKSPYSYKNSSKVTGMEYHTGTLAKWAKAKRIRLRDEKGRYKKGNYKSIGFILARSIKEKGIKPSLFFTKPFEKAFDNLPADLIDSFNLDIDDLLDFTT
jgi:hypothetical protein